MGKSTEMRYVRKLHGDRMAETQRETHCNDDRPRSMRDAAVRERRRAMLGDPHINPLTYYVAKLRQSGSNEVPDFDPLDGGVNARVLFLFEKPGSAPVDFQHSVFRVRAGRRILTGTPIDTG